MNSHKLAFTVSLAAFIELLAMGQIGWAASVSMNFRSDDGDGGNPLLPGESAGLISKPQWNNFTYAPNATNPPLVYSGILDENGGATTMQVRATAWDGRPQLVLDTIGNDPNARMMSGRGPSPFSSGTDAHLYAAVELSNILASLGNPADYDVYVYIGNGIGTFASGSFGETHLTTAFSNNNGPVPPPFPSILASSSYSTLNSPATGTSGIPVYATNVGFIDASTGPGNYLLFSDRTEDYLVIQPEMFDPFNNFRGVSIEGIQLIVEPIPFDSADTDKDGDVDTADLTTMFQNFVGDIGAAGGKTMMDGDADMDGDVDTADLTLGFQQFTGALAGLANNPDLVYDPTNGNVKIFADGANVLVFNLQSAAQFNTPADFTDLDADVTIASAFTDNTPSAIGWTSAIALANIGFDGPAGSVNTLFADLGNILPTGLDLADLTALLTNRAWGGPNAAGGDFDLVVSQIPEPTSLILLALGMLIVGACWKRKVGA